TSAAHRLLRPPPAGGPAARHRPHRTGAPSRRPRALSRPRADARHGQDPALPARDPALWHALRAGDARMARRARTAPRSGGAGRGVELELDVVGVAEDAGDLSHRLTVAPPPA